MTAELTGAELLRKAAQDMRERAEAATPGPWSKFEEHGRDITGEGWSDIHVVSPAGPVAWTSPDSDPSVDAQADAEHIAAWHPNVTFAVAEALQWQAGLSEIQADSRSDLTSRGWDMSDPWEAVARAYLGEQP